MNSNQIMQWLETDLDVEAMKEKREVKEAAKRQEFHVALAMLIYVDERIKELS